ncbi:hypothetical protein QFC21_005573 [Naganishia friedmannii]|uniref:Uncharacterized protein n=1 Tax=Naganishia friedmannii TaxID=89922 RepID=A0ACC2VA19_9TREE|nr:hypothetical protein QFC21_005573 [Naganishia friedmannii]
MPSFMAKRRRKKRDRQQQQQLVATGITPVTALAVPETVPAPESPLRRLLRRTSSLASGLSRRRTRDSQNDGLNTITSTAYAAGGRSPDRLVSTTSTTGAGTTAGDGFPATPPPQRQRISSLLQNRNSSGMTPLTPSPAAVGQTSLGRAADDLESPLRARQDVQENTFGSPLPFNKISSSAYSPMQHHTQTQQKHQRSSSDADSIKNRYSGSHLPLAETRPSEVVKVETIASSRSSVVVEQHTGNTKSPVIDRQHRQHESSGRRDEESSSPTTATEDEGGFLRFEHPASVPHIIYEPSLEIARQPEFLTPAGPALVDEEEEDQGEPSRSYLSLRTALAAPPGPEEGISKHAVMAPQIAPLPPSPDQLAGKKSPQIGSSSPKSVREGIVPISSYDGGQPAGVGRETQETKDLQAMKTEGEGTGDGTSSSRVNLESIRPSPVSLDSNTLPVEPLDSAVPSDPPSPSSPNANTGTAPLVVAQEHVPSPVMPPSESRVQQRKQLSDIPPRHEVELAPIVSGADAPISYSHEEPLPALLFGTPRKTTSSKPSGLWREGEDVSSDEMWKASSAALAVGAASVDAFQDPFVVSASTLQTTTDAQESNTTRFQDLETTDRRSSGPGVSSLDVTAQDVGNGPTTVDSGTQSGIGEREDAMSHVTEEGGFGAVVTAGGAHTIKEEHELTDDPSSPGRNLDTNSFADSFPSQHIMTTDLRGSEITKSRDTQFIQESSSGLQVPALRHAVENTGTDGDHMAGSSAQLDTAARENTSSRLTDIDRGLGAAALAVPTYTFDENYSAPSPVNVQEEPSGVTDTSAYSSTTPQCLEAIQQTSNALHATSFHPATQETDRESTVHSDNALLNDTERLRNSVRHSQNLDEADVRPSATDAVGVREEANHEGEGDAEDDAEEEESRNISQVLDSADITHIDNASSPIIQQQPTPPTKVHEPIRTEILAFSPAEHAAHLVCFSRRGFMTPIQEVPTPLSVHDAPTPSDPDQQYLHEAATTEIPITTADESPLVPKTEGAVARLVTRYVQPEETVDNAEPADDAEVVGGPKDKRLPFPTSTSSSTPEQDLLPSNETALVPARPINDDRPLLPFVPRLFAPRLTLEFKWTDQLLPSDITLNTTTIPPATTTNVVALRPRERRISVYEAARNVSAYGASYVPRNRLTSWAFGESGNA